MKKPLYIIDGYGLIYRSYFAFMRAPLYNSRGENVSAVFGFFRTLFSLLRRRNPLHLVVAMDSKTKTFRHDLYQEYKANREKTPEDLHQQIPEIEKILTALGIPMLRCDGFEADDLIATLTARCSRAGRRSFIVSGDKDLLQLADENASILYPKKGEYLEMGAEEIEEGWGVRAEQIIDYLSLTGDQADNIPGIKGIGPKTAAGLLRKYGTLEKIFENISSIQGAQKKKLETGKESAFLSRTLIVLRNDVPLPEAVNDYSIENLNTKEAIPLFLEHGMKGIVQDLGGAGDESPSGPAGGPQKRGRYETVVTESALDSWINTVKNNKWFAFDTETDNIEAFLARPVGFSLSVASGSGCYIPIKAGDAECLGEEKVKEALITILTDPELHCIGQNIKYDYQVMKRWGVEIQNISFDTMVAAWLINSQLSSFSMDNLAEHYLDGYKTIHFKDIVEKGSTFDTVPLEQAGEYAAEDADVTFRLYELFDRELDRENLRELFTNLELPLIKVLAEIELRGIRLAKPVLEDYSKDLSQSLSCIKKEIFEKCGEEFNINSTKQLQEILFVKRKLKPIKKTKTGYSTDTSVLEELSREDPVPELVLRHRVLSKLKSTYVDTLPRLVNENTGRIHTHFIQTGTATGRLSSRDPNLQNIPIKTEEGRQIRNAFIPEEDSLFLTADYSQIELVVLAHLSGDTVLKKAFTEGLDVHCQTGALIFGVPVSEVSDRQRRIAKIINFGVMYGMSGFRLSRELGIPRAEADRFIESYFAKYASVRKYMDTAVAAAEESGYVRTLLGRRRKINGITSRNRTEKMAAQRIAVNTTIQGTAADIVKLAMLSLEKKLPEENLEAKLLLQVHDELIFEVSQKDAGRLEALVKQVMESAVRLSVPLRVHIETGNSWGEFH